MFEISEELLRRNVKRFLGGLVFKAHKRVYHSTLGSGVIKKKKKLCTLAHIVSHGVHTRSQRSTDSVVVEESRHLLRVASHLLADDSNSTRSVLFFI